MPQPLFLKSLKLVSGVTAAFWLLAASAAEELRAETPASQLAQVEGEPTAPLPPPEAAPVDVQAPPEMPPPPAEAPMVADDQIKPREMARKMIKAMREDPETDHQKVVGRWGIEARRLGSRNVSRLTPGCSDPLSDIGRCTVNLNAIGVRRWMHEKYAWNAALVFATGGGSSMDASWDTYLGIGPSVGANFLLGQWKHMAVSALPQLDFVFFMPSSSGSKQFLVNVNALVEAEIQLGFIGLPGVSVGAAAGLVGTYMYAGESDRQGDERGSESMWSVGLRGPDTLWGLVETAFIRFYF
jgi:hypothetical protein